MGDKGAGLHIHIGTRKQRFRRAVGKILRHPMHRQFQHGPEIADHQTMKAPFFAQDVIEQKPIGDAGGAIGRVEGGHKASDAALRGGFKGRQFLIAQGAQ